MDLTLFKGETLPINYPTEGIVLTSIAENKKHSYDFILINFVTLVRNFLTALDFEGEVKDKSKKKFKILKEGEFINKYYDMFKKDLEIIDNIFNDHKIKPIYYFKDYKKVAKCLENYLLPEDLPPARALTEKYSKSFKIPTTDENIIKIVNDFRDVTGEKYLLVTHNAVDLTKYQYKDNVRLVESFTGELKPYEKWYTKYKKIGDKDMSVFPFNGLLLTVLGCNNYIRPGKIKLKRRLYDLAKKHRWNSTTGLIKIRNDLMNKDPILFRILKEKEGCYKKI